MKTKKQLKSGVIYDSFNAMVEGKLLAFVCRINIRKSDKVMVYCLKDQNGKVWYETSTKSVMDYRLDILKKEGGYQAF